MRPLFVALLRTSDCAVALDGLGSRDALADACCEYGAGGSPSAEYMVCCACDEYCMLPWCSACASKAEAEGFDAASPLRRCLAALGERADDDVGVPRSLGVRFVLSARALCCLFACCASASPL